MITSSLSKIPLYSLFKFKNSSTVFRLNERYRYPDGSMYFEWDLVYGDDLLYVCCGTEDATIIRVLNYKTILKELL